MILGKKKVFLMFLLNRDWTWLTRLLQLPPLSGSLAVRRHPGLALVGCQDLQLPVKAVRQLIGLALLGLVKPDLE